MELQQAITEGRRAISPHERRAQVVGVLVRAEADGERLTSDSIGERTGYGTQVRPVLEGLERGGFIEGRWERTPVGSGRERVLRLTAKARRVDELLPQLCWGGPIPRAVVELLRVSSEGWMRDDVIAKVVRVGRRQLHVLLDRLVTAGLAEHRGEGEPPWRGEYRLRPDEAPAAEPPGRA